MNRAQCGVVCSCLPCRLGGCDQSGRGVAAHRCTASPLKTLGWFCHSLVGAMDETSQTQKAGRMVGQKRVSRETDWDTNPPAYVCAPASKTTNKRTQ